ncbi:MAG: hypothetical protein U9R51_08985 [Actinomycetota bacterium]|nr:hypothetical protein [Actinomycetota bacterium]
MPDIDRRLLIGIPIVVIVLLLIGFGIGRLTAGDWIAATSGTEATDSTKIDAETPLASGNQDSTQSTINGDAAAAIPRPESDAPDGAMPVYGTEDEREALLTGLVEAGVAGGTREGILATADHVCYNLDRLQAQHRSPAFAVRVVWNESMAEIDSRDLAAFGIVFTAAPHYLCPDSIEYGEEVAYWLGY